MNGIKKNIRIRKDLQDGTIKICRRLSWEMYVSLDCTRIVVPPRKMYKWEDMLINQNYGIKTFRDRDGSTFIAV